MEKFADLIPIDARRAPVEDRSDVSEAAAGEQVVSRDVVNATEGAEWHPIGNVRRLTSKKGTQTKRVESPSSEGDLGRPRRSPKTRADDRSRGALESTDAPQGGTIALARSRRASLPKAARRPLKLLGREGNIEAPLGGTERKLSLGSLMSRHELIPRGPQNVNTNPASPHQPENSPGKPGIPRAGAVGSSRLL